MSMLEKMLKRKLREVVTDKFIIDLNMPTEYPPIKAPSITEGGVRERFFASVKELPDEITVVRPFCTDGFPESNKNTLYVAEDGCDGNAGTKDAPLATVHEALNRVRGLGGAKIVMRGGNYNFEKSAIITEEHSGTVNSPLIITAEKGETPIISASHTIPSSAFLPVTDEKVLARIKPEVREKVLAADLPSLGIPDYGKLGYGGAQLLVNNTPQVIARYPNEGEELIPMSNVIFDKGGRVIHRGPDDRGFEAAWEIGITDPRCLEWEWHEDIWLFGALWAEWGRRFAPIGAFNAEKMSMRGRHAFEWGLKWEPDNNYYFLNILEELDVPGEWYLDRETGKLYYYPTEDGLTEDTEIRFVPRTVNLFKCEKAENVIINSLDLGRCCGAAFLVNDCRQVLIQRCHIVATNEGGEREDDSEYAVVISGGYRNGIIASYFEHFTSRVCVVEGGDRNNFIPSNNFMQNCIAANGHSRFGTSMSGCGNFMSHNYFLDTTMADCGHNEGILEYNIVEGGDGEANDSGMIYIGGGGGPSCANHYRYNYLFGSKKCDYMIYFDDMSRGMYAYGNVVVGNGTLGDGTQWFGGGRSFNHHNGGEHCFWNNISIDAGYFAFGGDITYWLYDEHWRIIYPGGMVGGATPEKRSERYVGRNPTYGDFLKALDAYTEDLKDPNYEPRTGWGEKAVRAPWHNHYENNLIVRAGRPFKLDIGLETATGLETNYYTQDDPGFVDLEGKDYRIKPDAEVFKKIPGFIAPPFEKMGLVDDFEE